MQYGFGWNSVGNGGVIFARFFRKGCFEGFWRNMYGFEQDIGSKGGRWMDDDLVLVPKEDAKLLMELHRISEKRNCVDGLKYNKQSREWVYYEEVKHRKTVIVK